MTNDTTSMEMNIMSEVANLVQVGMSILDLLGSETLSCPKKAQKLRDPVLSICRLLPAVKIDDDWETTRRWVREVSNALYEASDLVDTAVADGAALAASSSLVSKVRCRSLFGLSKSSGNSLFGVRMGPIINRLCQTLSHLKQKATDPGPGLGLEEVDVALMTEQPLPVVTPPHYNMNTIVGREFDTKIILRVFGQLLETSDVNQHISVLSIAGMGGIGKTTVAKLVYNNKIITDHFDLKLWVRVSKEFEIKKIISSIILSCSAASSRIGDLGLERLIDILKVKISGKIFFLVLDDVWNEDHEKWDHLLTLLQVGTRGSKILVTTRSEKVAAAIRNCIVCHLQGLSEEKSWFLFKNILFGQLPPPDNLISILQDIVKSCAGIPLAIKVVASSLRGRSVEEWQKARSLFYEISGSGNCDLMPSLMIGYDYLLPPLRVCFAYCSLFPEDHEISVNDLVSLWMAQGYIRPGNSQDDLEDIAMQYFLTLSNHFFFINKSIDEFGNITTCMMHDKFQDLAITAAEGWGIMKHLSLLHKRETMWLRENWLKDQRKLHSFLQWTAADDEDGAAGSIISINDIVEKSNFESLRVLDLHAFGLQVLPDSISNLVHLRYLDFSHNEALLKLPNSITNLYHLQTLKLNFCYELEELPTSIGKLVRLRRLEIDGCEKLTFMPPSFKSLSSLRTLSRFVVGRPHPQFTSGFEALGNLKHLRGRLMIELSENWAAVVDGAINSDLSNKNRLTELGITWGPTRHTRETDTVQYKKLLDGLQPPSSLKMLQIEGYRGQDFPSWASGNDLSAALPNLITVSIDGCGQCTTLPPFSRLPFLRRLSLRFMDNVHFFESSDNLASPFFPSLQELTLHSFYSLEGWWKEERRVLSASFRCLLKLKIWSCPKLTSMPLFPKVEILDMQNINEKLLEFHSAGMTGSKLQTSTAASTSCLEITTAEPKSSTAASTSCQESTTVEPREHSQYLQDLKTVHIKSCPRLTAVVLGKICENLKKLVVEKLDILSSLNEVLKQLTSLEELEVADCKELDFSGGLQGSCNGCEKCDEPWKFLSKLHRLSLRELPKLVTLPAGLRLVKTLRTLCISMCDNLSTLPQWVSNLSSLQHLKLEGCPAITMLPEGLKVINSLVKVDIIECPQLMERCRDGGEDWYKIQQARVFCHKSWRYLLMSEAELAQKPKEKEENVVVRSEDPTIHVNVTVRRE